MKKQLLLSGSLLMILLSLFSQVPHTFSYQAIIRDSQGEILSNKDISLKVKLIPDEKTNAAIYIEEHFVKTNEFGLVKFLVGSGKAVKGLFSEIKWETGSYFMAVEVDLKNTGEYAAMGTTQLVSVPYALFAEKAGNENTRAGEWGNDGTNIFSDETSFPSSNVGIGTTIPGGKLQVYGDGFGLPNDPMLFIQHQNGFSSAFRRNVNNQANALFLLQKSRGTKEAPVIVQNGDNVGQIRMEAFDGSVYKTAGWIRAQVNGIPSEGIMPGALLFATTDFSGNVTERMRIISSGNVGIGLTNPVEKFHVHGMIYSSVGGIRFPDGSVQTSADDGTLVLPFADTVEYGDDLLRIVNTGSGSAIMGKYEANGNYGKLGTGNDGVYGVGYISTGAGVAGLHVNDGAGVYGYSVSGYAGFFEGTISISESSAYRIDSVPVLHNKGADNIFVGDSAGFVVTGGTGNTALGYYSLRDNTSGNYNTAAGAFALASNIGSQSNSAFGYEALFNNADGNYNTAVGEAAMKNNETGNKSTAIGYKALYSQTGHALDDDLNNTAVGYYAMYSTNPNDENNGRYNVAVGYNSMKSNTNGRRNTALGCEALQFNNSGDFNVALGYRALYFNNLGNYNIAIGHQAHYQNSSGNANVAIGGSALQSSSLPSYNVAVGYYSMIQHYKNNFNTAVGYQSLYSDTIGEHQTAIGNKALNQNKNGKWNTAVGSLSLESNVTGNNNTGIGYAVLNAVTTGTGNTAIGDSAGYAITEGSYNTFVGDSADASFSNLTNASAIGHGALVTASHNIQVGNNEIVYIGGVVGWGSPSDRSVKRNIEKATLGLDFIMDLKPVNFELIYKGQEGKQYEGFIAQDVEETLINLGEEFSGLYRPPNKSSIYHLRYASFVVPLVKAVQEQQTLINQLQKQNEKLASEIEDLKSNLGH